MSASPVPENRPLPPGSSLSGLRVLVVEDDYFVARSLGLLLEALECEVVGPVSTSEEACVLAREEQLDAAVLDIALSPGTSAPIARALQYRNCPFLFVTGYSSIGMLPDDLRGRRVLLKPVDCDSLRTAIRELVDGSTD